MRLHRTEELERWAQSLANIVQFELSKVGLELTEGQRGAVQLAAVKQVLAMQLSSRGVASATQYLDAALKGPEVMEAADATFTAGGWTS